MLGVVGKRKRRSYRTKQTTPCSTCGATDRNPSGGCRPCKRARMKANAEQYKLWRRAWAKRNPEKVRAQNRKKKYGLTVADLAEILARQGDKCPICEREVSEASDVDHDHQTGRVRGVLCKRCNLSLGWYENRTAKIHGYLS